MISQSYSFVILIVCKFFLLSNLYRSSISLVCEIDSSLTLKLNLCFLVLLVHCDRLRLYRAFSIGSLSVQSVV